MIPDIQSFEERVAIAQHNGDMTHHQVETLAAQQQGFADAEAYWRWLTSYVLARSFSSVVISGSVVVLKALDEVPPHLFRVDSIVDDTLCGVALTGPLAGEYGEPDKELVDRIIWQNKA